MRDPQLGHDVAGVPLPIDQHLAHPGMREHPIDAVALEPLRSVDAVVNDRSGTVPGEEVPALAVHPRGTLPELLEQTMHTRGDDACVRMPVAAGFAALPREREEVLRLAGLQPQRRGDPPQRICGRLDVSRLLEPRVPLGADARQCGYFL